MGWFGEEGLSEAAVAQALELAKRQALPQSARSLTRPELLDKHRNLIGFAALGLALFFLLVLFFAARESKAMAATVLLIGLVALIGMFVAGRARMRRYRDYRDPRIRIEAREDGVTFANGEATHVIGWLEIEARVNYTVGENRHVTFVGLKLESPFGLIPLEDGWYQNGRLLAAEIVQGRARAEAAREWAKVGITPA